MVLGFMSISSAKLGERFRVNVSEEMKELDAADLAVYSCWLQYMHGKVGA